MASRRLILAVSLLVLLPVVPLASARAAADAAGVVADFGDRTLRMLNDQSLSNAERQGRFRSLLEQDFDFQRISRFVLGRYWQGASDEQRQQFAAVFKDYVVQAYANRFNEFSGATFKVTGQRPEGQSLDLVSTQIMRRAGGAPARVDWLVTRGDQGYKISEVIVDGISMSLTHRQEFASIIERNGGNVSDLIVQLRQRTGGTIAKQPQ